MSDAALYSLGSLASAGINAAGNKKSQERAYNYTKQLNEQAREWQLMMWNLQNEYNLPANEVKRLLDAGINPALQFSNAGAGAAPVPSASSGGSVGSPSLSVPNLGVAASVAQSQQRVENETLVAKSQADLNEANADAARASAGLSDEQANYTKLNAEIIEATKDIVKEHKALSYRMDELAYALGLNKKTRDDIYTASFASENARRLEHMRLDNRLLERRYDLLQKQIDLAVATKKLTEQQAREVSLRADMLFCDRYFAEWSYNYAREFNKSIYGSSDSVNAGSEAFQNVIFVAKKNIANSVVRSQFNEAILSNDYGFEINHGRDYRFYQYEDLRRGANLKRVHQYTDVISSISQAASMAVSAGSSAAYRGAIVKSMNRTNRSFGFPGYGITPNYDFDF